MRDMFVYLAGPITARNGYTIEDNKIIAEQVLYQCLKIGIPCFMPPIIPHSEVDYETCLQYDNAVIRRCTHMLMLPRWDESPGALKERALAIELGIPIIDSFEELKETYGEPRGVRETATRKVRGRNRTQNIVGEERSDERLQQGNSEGAHHTSEQSQD